jgi:hypothetical protein
MLTGCGAIKGKAAAEKAVSEFHDKLDKGDFKSIYSETHADFKKAATEKDFVALLEAVHRKLGKLEKSEPAGWNANTFNFQTNIVLTYKTKFAEGDAVETFNYRVDGDRAQLCGYNINSPTLITK